MGNLFVQLAVQQSVSHRHSLLSHEFPRSTSPLVLDVEVFGGIRDALAAGDIELAAQILWTALQLAWLQGTQALQVAWANFRKGFVEVAAAVFIGMLEIWERVRAALATSWENTVSFFGDIWDGFVGYFTNVWNTAIDEIAKGINFVRGLFDDSFDSVAANTAIDDQSAQGDADGRKEEMQRKNQRDKDRDANINKIDQDKQKAIKEIQDRERAITDDAGQNAGDDIEVRLKKLEEMKKRLADQIAKANAEAEGKGTPEGAKKPEFNPFAAGQALHEATKIAAAGTFNAAAVQGLQGNTTDEYLSRTAAAVEEVSKNTKVRPGVTFR